MIPVGSIYEDAVDTINMDENGRLSFTRFNRFSKRAELRLLDFLTSDVEDKNVPEMYLSQKNKDWVEFLITPHPSHLQKGILTKPTDYYAFENMKGIGGKFNCDTDTLEKGFYSIELLSGSQYNERLGTDIEELKPANNPICKLMGRKFIFAPEDIGGVELEYIRYPKFATVVTKADTVHNDEVVDEAASTNYEWDEYARELLLWFIVDSFANRNREQALKGFQAASGKLVRDEK